jgi:hypothetical protein
MKVIARMKIISVVLFLFLSVSQSNAVNEEYYALIGLQLYKLVGPMLAEKAFAETVLGTRYSPDRNIQKLKETIARDGKQHNEELFDHLKTEEGIHSLCNDLKKTLDFNAPLVGSSPEAFTLFELDVRIYNTLRCSRYNSLDPEAAKLAEEAKLRAIIARIMSWEDDEAEDDITALGGVLGGGVEADEPFIQMEALDKSLEVKTEVFPDIPIAGVDSSIIVFPGEDVDQEDIIMADPVLDDQTQQELNAPFVYLGLESKPEDAVIIDPPDENDHNVSLVFALSNSQLGENELFADSQQKVILGDNLLVDHSSIQFGGVDEMQGSSFKSFVVGGAGIGSLALFIGRSLMQTAASSSSLLLVPDEQAINQMKLRSLEMNLTSDSES